MIMGGRVHKPEAKKICARTFSNLASLMPLMASSALVGVASTCPTVCRPLQR